MAYNRRVRILSDEAKSRANERKHGTTFEKAAALFMSGVDYLETFDDAHSDLEDRFLATGPIARGLVLIVWTEPEDDRIRIVSARWATKRERIVYESKVRDLS